MAVGVTTARPRRHRASLVCAGVPEQPVVPPPRSQPPTSPTSVPTSECEPNVVGTGDAMTLDGESRPNHVSRRLTAAPYDPPRMSPEPRRAERSPPPSAPCTAGGGDAGDFLSVAIGLVRHSPSHRREVIRVFGATVSERVGGRKSRTRTRGCRMSRRPTPQSHRRVPEPPDSSRLAGW